jgi:16S rRNA (guanine1207-N2)-methyltransferase
LESAVYGLPPQDLAITPVGAVQMSPLIPGSAAIEDLAPASLDAFVIAAPPATLERRYVLAMALRALRPGGELKVLAPKDKGGSRLGKELASFGCAVDERGQSHHRICATRRPEAPVGLDETIAAGAPRLDPQVGLWTQPGVFSWDRPDPGSLLLLNTLPPLTGKGADLGCGIGVLSNVILGRGEVEALALADIDRRAIAAAQRNVDDPRASFHWVDARTAPTLAKLDFVVMNPPFHDGGTEDRALGQAFIKRAHGVLRQGGALWLVANRHLPYEETLRTLFTTVTLKAEAGGFKVYEARK